MATKLYWTEYEANVIDDAMANINALMNQREGTDLPTPVISNAFHLYDDDAIRVPLSKLGFSTSSRTLLGRAVKIIRIFFLHQNRFVQVIVPDAEGHKAYIYVSPNSPDFVGIESLNAKSIIQSFETDMLFKRVW